jgi:cell wall-associated NlpC family hydrolase
MTDAEKQSLLASGAWRDAVIAETRTWMWTPYRHASRVKGVGVDCGGLLYQVYDIFLGPFKGYPDYPPDWALHKANNEIYLDFIMPYVQRVDAPVRGGFTLFQFARAFSHAAIFTGEKYIHAWGRSTAGCVKEDSPLFFMLGNQLREAQHFDVSSQWLCSLSP